MPARTCKDIEDSIFCKPCSNARKRMPKTIAIVCSYSESLISFRGDLIKVLLATGARVNIFVPDCDPKIKTELESWGCKMIDIPLARTGMNPLKDLMLLFALYKKMRTVQPDIVLAYTVKPVVYGALAASMLGIQQIHLMITGLGFAFDGHDKSFKRKIASGIVHRLYKMATNRAQRVYFQNEDDRDLFVGRGLVELSKVQLINGSGIHLTKFAHVPKTPNTDKVVFLLIARFLVNKGIYEYVEAAKTLKDKYQDKVTFQMVGWCDESPSAIKKTDLDDWIASGTIDYLGKLEDVREAIAQSDVYVLPSYREGTPRSVLEAMAVGRAVVTTDAPGCRNCVEDSVNGFKVPVQSVDALAAAMARFVDAPELIESMGMASRQRAESVFDVNKVNQVLLENMRV